MVLTLNIVVHDIIHLCGPFCMGHWGQFHEALTNLYFLTSADNKMHSLVRKSSLVRRKGIAKPAPGKHNSLHMLSSLLLS